MLDQNEIEEIVDVLEENINLAHQYGDQYDVADAQHLLKRFKEENTYE